MYICLLNLRLCSVWTCNIYFKARWRMHKVRKVFRHRQTSIIAIQCLWRQKLAKRELRRHKQVRKKLCYWLWSDDIHQMLFFMSILFIHFLQEANEAGALRLAKSKLEKQLEDLTWRLQLEKRLRVMLFFFSVVLFWMSYLLISIKSIWKVCIRKLLLLFCWCQMYVGASTVTLV